MLFFPPKLIFMNKMRVSVWLRSKLNVFFETWRCQPCPGHHPALQRGENCPGLWGRGLGCIQAGTHPQCHPELWHVTSRDCSSFPVCWCFWALSLWDVTCGLVALRGFVVTGFEAGGTSPGGVGMFLLWAWAKLNFWRMLPACRRDRPKPGGTLSPVATSPLCTVGFCKEMISSIQE